MADRFSFSLRHTKNKYNFTQYFVISCVQAESVLYVAGFFCSPLHHTDDMESSLWIFASKQQKIYIFTITLRAFCRRFYPISTLVRRKHTVT